MNMQKVNKSCYVMCIVCLVFGAVLTMAMVWGTISSTLLATAWGVVATCFIGSVLALSVSQALGERDKE